MKKIEKKHESSQNLTASEIEYNCSKKYYEKSEKPGISPEVKQELSAIGADFLFISFLLGNYKAPYNLYQIFKHGAGVEQNEYLAKIMYGVALKLHDTRCDANKYVFNKSFKKNIDNITHLVKLTHNLHITSRDNIKLIKQQGDLFDLIIPLSEGNFSDNFFSLGIKHQINQIDNHEDDNSILGSDVWDMIYDFNCVIL